MTCGQCGAPSPNSICRECELLDALEEDFARERLVSKTGQNITAAINRSVDGETDETRARIRDARRHWSADDRIGEHLDCAARMAAFDPCDTEVRRHLREAAQLLGARDPKLGFVSGGELA